MSKKLSIALIWHMHQPAYQTGRDSIYLMPWVRMHAIKDYLDMLLIMDNYPSLKLNFNLVPVLVDSIYDYGYNGAHDIYSKLTIAEKLSDEEKEFVLNHFFDANYKNMVLHHEEYKKLYEKRYSREDISINDFTEQEYFAVMAWFNLAWFDPYWRKSDELVRIAGKKNEEFTLEDRQTIIELQRKICREIVPQYKKYQQAGRIEISVSPYYHPILPLLLDINETEKSNPSLKAPKLHTGMKDDAIWQVKSALDKFEELFGKRPEGVWPSEHCISKKTLELFMDLGVKWTISDEGVLEQSLKTEFVRDFRGYLEDPYDLCNVYSFNTIGKKINILFRDSVLPNLIAFEYPNHNPEKAAYDLFDRIKTIQAKLRNSPEQNHLLTIAMDGENCWENYAEDGHLFLSALYKLLTDDEGLETVRVSDYLEKSEHSVRLSRIHPGSWINRDFSLWAGEPTKNLAWEYLDKTRADLISFEKEKPDKELLRQAWNEVYVCEGSDWYWWYGEPNDSGQDEIFDLIFRERLQNVYKILNKPVPDYLNQPLISYFTKGSRYPRGDVGGFELDGCTQENWKNAGCIDIPSTPTMQENRLFNKIYFGSDADNLYLRFDINKFNFDKSTGFKELYNVYIYFRNKPVKTGAAHIRAINRTDAVLPLLKELYSSEVRLSFFRNFYFNAILSHANTDCLWIYQLQNNIKFVFKDFVEVRIPFDDIGVTRDSAVEFFVIQSQSGLVDAFYPQNSLLSVVRR